MKKMGAFLSAGLVLLCAAYARADMMIYPKYVSFDDDTRVQEMTLINPSIDETIQYRIRLKYARQNLDGSYTDVAEPGFTSGTDLLRFSPRSVTLGPKKSQTVKLLKRLPEGTPPGEYTAYIVFTRIPTEKPLSKPVKQKTEGVSIELTPIPSFSIPVIVTVGKETSDKPVLSYRGRNAEFAQQPLARVRLARKGTVKHPASRTLRGDISVWQEGRLLGIIKGKYLLAGTKYVDVAVPLTMSAPKPGEKITVLFTEFQENDGIDAQNEQASVSAVL